MIKNFQNKINIFLLKTHKNYNFSHFLNFFLISDKMKGKDEATPSST